MFEVPVTEDELDDNAVEASELVEVLASNELADDVLCVSCACCAGVKTASICEETSLDEVPFCSAFFTMERICVR